MANNTGSVEKQVDFDLANAEWAHIALGKVVVATKKRAWVYQPQSEFGRFLNGADAPASRRDFEALASVSLMGETSKTALHRFSGSMTGAGSFATTGKLLDTAIAAAKHTVNSDVRPPALTSTRWIWRLASAYHMTSDIPEIMETAARGFAANNCSTLEAWALEKVEEEKGHDKLALLDLKSLGYDAEAVVKALIPPAAQASKDYLKRSVADSNPIDCVGYTYTMERLSLGIGADYIQNVEALLPPGVNATRCLRVHSSIGADAGHVGENVSLVAELSAPERSRIARACYETALMLFSPASGEYITDAEILQIVEPFKID